MSEPGAVRDSPSTDPTHLLMQLLTGGRARRWKDAVGWSIAGFALAMKGRAKLKTWKAGRAYSVAVVEQDDIYADVQEWLLDRIPTEERRGLLAATRKGGHSDYTTMGDSVPSDGAAGRTQRAVWLAYDGDKDQNVMIDGHKVAVTVKKREMGRQDTSGWGQPARIIFTSESLAGRDAAVAFLQEVADACEQRRRGASLYVATKWGEWARANDLPPRPIGSVVLAGTQREDLIADLARFVNDEDVYVRLGIPWHRGYLFHGPAGTGKTSIAKALAGHLGLDLYYMPLGDLASDTDLARLLSNLSPRAVLLLEDIDVAHDSAKHRTTEHGQPAKGVSLSGLLQALDGVLTPHGLVTMMTTNNLHALDDALVRIGRADVTVRIDYLVDEQLLRLLDAIAAEGHGPAVYPPIGGQGITPAEVVELAKPHLRDPDAALNAVYTGLLDRVPAEPMP